MILSMLVFICSTLWKEKEDFNFEEEEKNAMKDELELNYKHLPISVSYNDNYFGDKIDDLIE